MRKTSLWPRGSWLLLYVVANVAAAITMLATGQLVGDVSGFPVFDNGALIIALILVVASYVLFLWPVFNILTAIKVLRVKYGPFDEYADKRIGKILLFLQISFFVFNWAYGTNVAGPMSSKPDSLLTYLWILLPVDSLFIVYYGMYRSSKLFVPNLLIWVVSNVMRGWAGVFLFVLFFEWCRYARRRQLKFGKVIISGCLVLLLYPVLYQVKAILRTSGLNTNWAAIFSAMSDDYFTLIYQGVNQIVNRLQVTSIVVEVIRLQSTLQSEFELGHFTPFWMEGLHGIVYERLFGLDKSIPIGVAFTGYGRFAWDFTVGDWNTNIGYVGWLFIAPYLAPLYILYTLFLALVSVFMVKLLHGGKLAYDMLWFSWLVYLLPPWLGTFVGFIYSLFVFFFLKLLFSRIGKSSLVQGNG